MIDLKGYQVKGVPDACYYVPNFVTVEEEQAILYHVNNAPKSKWVQLSNRRLQNWGGTPLNGVNSVINRYDLVSKLVYRKAEY